MMHRGVFNSFTSRSCEDFIFIDSEDSLQTYAVLLRTYQFTTRWLIDEAKSEFRLYF